MSRVGIHDHNIDKRLESFALCYSQLLLLADFSPSYGFLRLEFSTATAEGGDFALCLRDSDPIDVSCLSLKKVTISYVRFYSR